jgi:sulfite exporter TauE/SafE
MSAEILILVYTAAGIGFIHTILGPDHYLPFIMIARAREWSLRRTLSLTVLCGLGHVLSSVVIGGIGIVVGSQIQKITWIESFRGDLAAWALTAFGLLYALWGLRHYLQHRRGKIHHHHKADEKSNITPWMLFIIFVLGPCEPLIPVLMYPAAHESIGTIILVASVFSIATIGTMTTLVWAATTGISKFRFKKLEPMGHFMAGIVIFASGMAIQFFGL